MSDEKITNWNWDPEKPSRALIASSGLDNGFVMEFVGQDLDTKITCVGTDTMDLGLGDAPEGLSIWEGRYVFVPHDDVEPRGVFRDLTYEEWNQLRDHGELWDPQDWCLPEDPTSCTL